VNVALNSTANSRKALSPGTRDKSYDIQGTGWSMGEVPGFPEMPGDIPPGAGSGRSRSAPGAAERSLEVRDDCPCETLVFKWKCTRFQAGELSMKFPEGPGQALGCPRSLQRRPAPKWSSPGPQGSFPVSDALKKQTYIPIQG